VRTLITTADERTWPKDKNEPVLFLGEWCRRFSRRQVWRQMNAEIVPYHWDNRKKLYYDYKYIQSIYEKVLLELSEKLNQLHNTNHSLRYWRILLGPWLGYFIQMLFDRWYMLRYAIGEYDITRVYIKKRSKYSVVPNDMENFQQLFAEDDWNEAIYSQLLKAYWSDQLEIIEVSNGLQQRVTAAPKGNGVRALLMKLIERFLLKFGGRTSKSDNYFFISPYLPLTMEFKLQINLSQFPRKWSSQKCPKSNINLEMRRWSLGGGEQISDDFFDIVRNFVPKHLPEVYLGGYRTLLQVSDKLQWSVAPKVMFTSNSYIGDDIFKSFASEKIEQGSVLVIGQHGGNFGMNTFAFHEEHQIEIADKWLSWGWSDLNRPQIVPTGCLKTMGGRAVKHDPLGDALMVGITLPRYSYHLYACPISRQWLDYFQDQKHFLEALPEGLRNRVLLRLYHIDYGWDQVERWKDTDLNVRYDVGKKNIRELIKKSRLYIATYNATTYLETFSWNIPTIMFWNPEHWELNNDAKPYFDLLKKAGVFHENPEGAAHQMVKVWDDVDAWWESDTVQSARKLFCEKYANTPKKPLKLLKTLFKGMAVS
jgi:putative transferase (TIGR04331 family)